MAVGVGDGTTVNFGTSGFSMYFMDVSGPDMQRGFVDTSHLASSGWKSFLPSGLIDGGTVTIQVQHDPAIDIAGFMDNDPETITIDWSGSGDTYVFSGFGTGYSAGARLDELMEATLTLKVTGTVTT